MYKSPAEDGIFDATPVKSNHIPAAGNNNHINYVSSLYSTKYVSRILPNDK